MLFYIVMCSHLSWHFTEQIMCFNLWQKKMVGLFLNIIHIVVINGLMLTHRICLSNKCERWLMLLSPLLQGHTQTSTPGITTQKMGLKVCREGYPMQYVHIVLTLDGQLITEGSKDISMPLGLLLCIFRIWNPVYQWSILSLLFWNWRMQPDILSQ